MAAHVGAGEMSGYIAAQHDEVSHERALPMRRYRIRGYALALEGSITFFHTELALAHQMFAGISNEPEFESRVVWPYNYFFLRLGVTL